MLSIKQFSEIFLKGGDNTMQLLPKYVTRKLPKLYEMEGKNDPTVICKFFLPMTKWTWYGIEFDGEDLFFGYVVGEYNELGYFRLSEISSVEGLYGLKVERDLYFNPVALSKVRRMHESEV